MWLPSGLQMNFFYATFFWILIQEGRVVSKNNSYHSITLLWQTSTCKSIRNYNILYTELCVIFKKKKSFFFKGFDISHALGGGVGSGFGSLITEKLGEQYPSRFISTYSIFPACNVRYSTILHFMIKRMNLNLFADKF